MIMKYYEIETLFRPTVLRIKIMTVNQSTSAVVKTEQSDDQPLTLEGGVI